jgi:hypothetical protein
MVGRYPASRTHAEKTRGSGRTSQTKLKATVKYKGAILLKDEAVPLGRYRRVNVNAGFIGSKFEIPAVVRRVSR